MDGRRWTTGETVLAGDDPISRRFSSSGYWSTRRRAPNVSASEREVCAFGNSGFYVAGFGGVSISARLRTLVVIDCKRSERVDAAADPAAQDSFTGYDRRVRLIKIYTIFQDEQDYLVHLVQILNILSN